MKPCRRSTTDRHLGGARFCRAALRARGSDQLELTPEIEDYLRALGYIE